MVGVGTVKISNGSATRCDNQRENDEGKYLDACHFSLLRTYLADICSTAAAKIQQTAPITKTGMDAAAPVTA